MCGIAGFLGSSPTASWRETATRLSRGLAHRGPDGEGFLAIHERDKSPAVFNCESSLQNANAAARGVIVHRRLSIIDLATGDQPMRSALSALWIAFNGEIYNHRELRQELSARHGCSFRTSSDTEVILESYRVWGTAGFAKLNGMFAFVLWDDERKTLLLARDPLGVKPLYWGRSPEGMWFSSELSVALDAGFVERAISHEHLARYLYYRFVPAPHTLWSKALKVRPGHVLQFDTFGHLQSEHDFTPQFAGELKVDEREAVVLLKDALPLAIKRQMVADVPIGAFLSGGLDSAILTSQMRNASGWTPTFAVGFDHDKGVTNELPQARRVASALGTEHFERGLDVEAYFESLPQAILDADEPVAHPGMLLQSYVSSLAREHVKAVLTGQGADEPLGGYPRHYALRLWELLRPAAPLFSHRAAVRRYAERNETFARILRLSQSATPRDRALSMFGPLSESEVLRWTGLERELGPEDLHQPMLHWWERGAGMDPLARALYVDSRTSLPEDLLLVGDRMSMRHSLEARVPFLDLEYMELVERLPGSLRVRLLKRRKHLQHAVARHLLPSQLQRELAATGRPWKRKVGFSVPVAEWFRNSVSSRLADFVSGPGAVLPEYLDAAVTRNRVDAFLAGHGRAYRLPLVLFVLECWLRMNIAGVRPTDVMAAVRPSGSVSQVVLPRGPLAAVSS